MKKRCESDPNQNKPKSDGLRWWSKSYPVGDESFEIIVCVHAALALREDGYETIMVNCNPETVSTDYDTSDRLYFEPVTRRCIRNSTDRKPQGVIVQYGGQTPLKFRILKGCLLSITQS